MSTDCNCPRCQSLPTKHRLADERDAALGDAEEAQEAAYFAKTRAGEADRALAAALADVERLRKAVGRAHQALISSQYVGGPSEREAWQIASEALGAVATQHQGTSEVSP